MEAQDSSSPRKKKHLLADQDDKPVGEIQQRDFIRQDLEVEVTTQDAGSQGQGLHPHFNRVFAAKSMV